MKYKLSDETKLFNGRALHRIIACKDIKTFRLDVKKGDKGGWVQSENNLSHGGSCWLADEAIACDNSRIAGDAIVKDHVILQDNSKITASALVCDYVQVKDSARISGAAELCGAPVIKDNAVVWGNAVVKNKAAIFGKSFIFGIVSENAHVGGYSMVYGNVSGFANLMGSVTVDKDSEVCENSILDGEIFLNNTKVASTSRRNLCSNFFNDEEPISFLYSDAITPASPNVYVAPINFMREKGRSFLTRGSLSVSIADSMRPVFKNITAVSGNALCKNLSSTLPPNFKELPEKYSLFPQVYEFANTLEDNDFRALAENFVSKIESINTYSLGFPDKKIGEEKELLLNLAQNYILAQFTGILFWANTPYIRADKDSEWFNFLDNLVNQCELDFSTKKIIGISSDVIFWNEEMVRMVAHVCGFSVLWQIKQCSILSESHQTVKLFH